MPPTAAARDLLVSHPELKFSPLADVERCGCFGTGQCVNYCR